MKLCYLNKDTLYFSVPSVVFTGIQLIALTRAGLLVMRRGCRLADGQSYCRCSEPFAATVIQAVKCLVKFATALLTCSCGNSSQIDSCSLQGDLQLISRLRLRLELYQSLLLQHMAPQT